MTKIALCTVRSLQALQASHIRKIIQYNNTFFIFLMARYQGCFRSTPASDHQVSSLRRVSDCFEASTQYGTFASTVSLFHEASICPPLLYSKTICSPHNVEVSGRITTEKRVFHFRTCHRRQLLCPACYMIDVGVIVFPSF